MKLYSNRPSPYGRKVLAVIHEKQLADRIEIILRRPDAAYAMCIGEKNPSRNAAASSEIPTTLFVAWR